MRWAAAAATIVAGALALVGAGAGCSRGSRARPAAAGGQAVGDSKRLPEDPLAGRRSEAQWRDFMVAEERERQLGYDRARLRKHQAVVKVLRDTRARLDAARTEVAVQRVRAELPAVMTDLQGRMTAIDHWGVNSPLLKQYQALMAILSTTYPDARLAVMRGGRGRNRAAPGGEGGDSETSRRTLETLRSDVDQRLQAMTNWLKEAAESEVD